jgi:hypothetical protein
VTTRREHVLAWLIVAASAVLLALAFLWGSVPDEEEYRFSILSALLHARGLAAGHWPFWTSALGLGMPHPLGQYFVWHPLMPLLAAMPVGSWVALLLVLHLSIGAVGMMRLGARLGLAPLPASSATATFLLASPMVNFAVTDFWPGGVVGWTIMPWLLVAMCALLDPASPPDRCRRCAAGLGLGAGLALENVHPGYLLLYGLPVAAFVAPQLSLLWARRWWWLMATALMLAIALPLVVQLSSEMAHFPPGLPRMNYEDRLGAAGFRNLFVKPLWLGFDAGWPSGVGPRVARGPFFGPFVWLACATFVVARWRGAHTRGLRAAFLVSLVCLGLPGLSSLVVIPATSLLRDPMTLFGTLLAAGVVDRLWRAGRRAAAALVAVQLAALVVAGVPHFVRAFTPQEPTWASLFTRERPMMRWLREQSGGAPGRTAYSVRVNEMVETRQLTRDGLWVNNAAYFNVRVANGRFKGVSLDALMPSDALPYGRFQLAPPLQRSAGTLALLGIRRVVAALDEPVAPELRLLSRFTDHAGRGFALYDNPDVTGAALVPSAALGAFTPVLAGCPHEGLLCQDLAALWAARERTAVRVQGDDGRLVIELETPAPPASTVVIGEMYRSEWRAEAGGGAAPIREVEHGLLGVDLPAGATRIELRYRPLARVAASLLAGLALALGLVLWAPWRRGPAQPLR